MSVLVDKNNLQNLLQLTQRPQNIAGKTNFQVNACMLHVGYNKLMTCSLVKDGLSSVAFFQTDWKGAFSPSENESLMDSSCEWIPIVNIQDMLGTLKYHSGQVSLKHLENSKLCVKSKNKQTTITSSVEALAFPHSPATLKEWHKKSLEINNKVRPEGVYITDDGVEIKAFAHYEDINTTDLYEALRCVNMNNQKLNEFTFEGLCKTPEGVYPPLKVTTGNELKGKTEHSIEYKWRANQTKDFSATFGGGLDHIMQLTTAPTVNLRFIDMTSYRQGIKLIMDFPSTEEVVLQTSIKHVTGE